MSAAASFTFQGNIAGMDLMETIREELYNDTDTLAQTLEFLVAQKTPVLTGALFSSIKGTGYHGKSSPLLVRVVANDQEQLDEWGRIYAPYQEGPSLGLATYTNPPHHMFADTASGDGIQATMTWATDAIYRGWDRCVNGKGVPVP